MFHPTSRKPIILLGVAAIAAAGIALHFHSRGAVPPIPPDPNPAGLEPAVVSAVRTARERALQEPKSAQAWGELGEVLFGNELEAEALTCFTEAARLDPRAPRWQYLQAVVFVNRGERETAIDFLKRTVELGEERGAANLVPRLVLAEQLLILGRVDEAVPQVQYALKRKPDDPRTRFDAGLLAIAQRDWEAARGHLNNCLGSPHARQKARIQLAAVAHRLGDPALAAGFQAEADRMPADADWPDPIVADYLSRGVTKRSRYKLAESLEAQGQFAEAARAAAPVVEGDPDDDVAQLLLGKILAQLGDFAPAERAIRQAIRIAPRKVQPYYYLSLVLLEQGRSRAKAGDKSGAEALLQEAVAQARQALRLKPDYGSAHLFLGLALKELGRRTEAVAELQQAVRCNPEFPEMHLELADVLFELGRGEEARIRYEAALRLAPPEAPWRAKTEARVVELKKPR